MVPGISLEAALGVAGGALLGAVVMLGLWLRARSTAAHVMEDLRALRQLARRERSDLERQVDSAQRAAQETTLRLAETEEALDSLTSEWRELQEAHTALRAAYLDAMGGSAPPSVRLTAASAPIEGAARAVALDIGSLAAQSASCRDAIVHCRRLMDDLTHDMHRAIEIGRRLAPPADQSAGFFDALEEGLVSVDSAVREARDQVELLMARADALTQHGEAMSAAAQGHAVAVRSLTTQWQQLEVATVPAPAAPAA